MKDVAELELLKKLLDSPPVPQVTWNEAKVR
jgi:hypothetical protein